MTKILQVIVHIEGDNGKPINAVYDAATGQWQVQGIMYSRHLKVLTAITDACRLADKGVKASATGQR